MIAPHVALIADPDLDPACREAWTIARSFLSESGDPGGSLRRSVRAERRARGGRMRAHFGVCPECHERYREAVRTLAHIGREQRAARLARERIARSRRLRRDAREAGAGNSGRRPIWRTLLYPAFFAYLFLWVGGVFRGSVAEPRAPGTLQPLAGEVLVDGVPAEELLARGAGVARAEDGTTPAGPGPVLLLGGEAIRTGGHGLARMRLAHGLELTLQAGTSLRFAGRRRVRLAGGLVVVEGRGVVETRHGVIELVGGEAVLELDARGLWVEARAGTVTHTGPGGVQALSGGGRYVAGRRVGD